MLVSTYHLSDTARANARRQWVDARPLVIGSAPDCHVVIDDPEVAPHHLQISNRGGDIVVENLGATAEVDGAELAQDGWIVVEEGRPIRIGGTIVKLRMQAQPVVTTSARPASDYPVDPNARLPTMRNPPNPYITMPVNPPRVTPQMSSRPYTRPRKRKLELSTNPTEQQLLVALRARPGDGETRSVYADWLEGHGFKAKSELLRLSEHLDTFIHKTATDIDWRAVAVRTPIDHCDRRVFGACPGSWDALSALPDDDYIRNCGTCKRDVRYCGERNDVRASGWEQAPVVFDASLDRVAAHAWYRNWMDGDEDDEIEDDPDGYTLDVPPSNFRK